MTLPVKAAPSRWSTARRRFKPSAPGAAMLNSQLDELESFAGALVLSGIPDDKLRAALAERLGKAAEIASEADTLASRFEAHLAEIAVRSKNQTMKAAKTAGGYLRSYLEAGGETGAMTLRTLPSEVGLNFLRGLQAHLIGAKLANSTVNKVVSRMKTFFRWLEERGEVDRVPPVRALPADKNAPLYLTPEELARVAQAKLGGLSAGHESARSIFLVCCATGQRVGDVLRMRWEHIRRDASKDHPSGHVLTWHLTTQKTGAVLRVPIIGPARRVVEAQRAAGATRPVPYLAVQKVNVYVKAVCERAGITQPVERTLTKGGERQAITKPKHEWITSHVGRKTFITLALQSGVQAQELLGFTHSDLRTLQLYAGQSETKRRDQLTEAFGGL